MKSKSIFLMAISLGFGLVAAIGITQVMGRSKSTETKKEPMVKVLIAKQDLDINTELTPEMFEEATWPAKLVPEGAVATEEDIADMVITARAVKSGLVFRQQLVHKTEVNLKKIPPGFKLIGIPVTAEDNIAGLLAPGDLVDLIAVFKKTRGTAPSSQTFLRKIRVYNVGSRTNVDVENPRSSSGKTIVGLLVTERQSEQIVLVNKIADLKIALRSMQDDDDEDLAASSGFSFGESQDTSNSAAALAQMLASTMGAAANAADPAGPANSTEPEKFTVTVYSSEGPVQYHFNQGETNDVVPERVEGFKSKDLPAVPQAPSLDAPPADLSMPVPGDEASDDDFDYSVEDLDSEPGA